MAAGMSLLSITSTTAPLTSSTTRTPISLLFGAARSVDLPGFCGERLAHFLGLSLEGDGALEAER